MSDLLVNSLAWHRKQLISGLEVKVTQLAICLVELPPVWL